MTSNPCDVPTGSGRKEEEEEEKAGGGNADV